MKIILLHGMRGLGEAFLAMAGFFLLWVLAVVLAIVHLVKANGKSPVNTSLKVISLIASSIALLPLLGAIYLFFMGGEGALVVFGLLLAIPLVLNTIALIVEKKKSVPPSIL